MTVTEIESPFFTPAVVTGDFVEYRPLPEYAQSPDRRVLSVTLYKGDKPAEHTDFWTDLDFVTHKIRRAGALQIIQTFQIPLNCTAEGAFIVTRYGGREGKAWFRYGTKDEAKLLTAGSHIWVRDMKGSARRVKVNGAPKTWKRDAARVEVPLKYGLYEYLTMRDDDIADGMFLVPVEEIQ